MSRRRPPTYNRDTYTLGPDTMTLFVFATIVPAMFFVGAGITYYTALSGGASAGTRIGTALGATGVASFLLSFGLLVFRRVFR